MIRHRSNKYNMAKIVPNELNKNKPNLQQDTSTETNVVTMDKRCFKLQRLSPFGLLSSKGEG